MITFTIGSAWLIKDKILSRQATANQADSSMQAFRQQPFHIFFGKSCLSFFLVGACFFLSGCAENSQTISPEPTYRQTVSHFAKWERVRDLESSNPTFPPGREVDADAKTMEEWRGLVSLFAERDDLERIDAVNRFFNKWPYRRDIWVYGEEEYWATPREFLQKSGDCEEYAITKYYALRSLGYGPDVLRLAGIWNSRRGEGHCVLLFINQGTPLVLDNFSNNIVPLRNVTHYIPQYYVNEVHLWLHEKKG